MKYRYHYKITGTFALEVPDALVTDVPTIMAYGAEFFSDAATQRETLNLAQEQHVAITGVEPVLEEVNA